MRDWHTAAVFLVPLLFLFAYYLASRPFTCRRCHGNNWNLKLVSYRCRHCGVRFY